MNWEAIGSVGEILSAGGVIFTLAYLAIQIRHSNKLATWETHRSSVESNSATFSAIVGDPDVARIYRTGFLNLDDLDALEKIRFHQLVLQMMLNFKDILDAYDKNLFDQPTYEAWQGYICAHLNMPGGRLWWEESKPTWIQRVRDEIERGMAEVPRADAIAPTLWTSDAPVEIDVPNPSRATHTGSDSTSTNESS